MEELKFLLVGDSAFSVQFGEEISNEINNQIRKVMESLQKENLDGILELTPTYCSILVNYNPLKISYETLKSKIEKFYSDKSDDIDGEEVNLIEIPTLYNDECGPDLEFVADHNNLSKEEVIKIHTGTDYLVYMLGFMPGFTYLGGMDERIATPRLETPRLKILPGSVGIAGKQTGMYPSMSPGGWRIIGRTPLKLYRPDQEPPVYINSGDYIRYVSISEEEYKKIEEAVSLDKYKVIIKKIKRGDLNV